jgi:hypothetical protein
VQGFDCVESGNLYHRYLNASGALPSESGIYGRAKAYTSLEFPNNPITKEYQRQPNLGIITYNFEYSTEIAPLLSGALSETIDISHNYKCDVVAEFTIPDRVAGPYIQDINTKTRQTRSLVYEAVVPATGGSALAMLNAMPDVNPIISGFIPTASTVKVIENGDHWNPKEGRISRQITWLYQ